MRQLCPALIFLAVLPAMAADVYRSVDENGTVVYSDRPDREGTERVFIATARPAPAARAPAASPSTQAQTPPAPGENETLHGEILQEPSADELAQQRAQNCSIAQQRAEQYRVAHRLYRTLPDGEREYLTDAELDQARAKAEADVASWCG